MPAIVLQERFPSAGPTLEIIRLIVTTRLEVAATACKQDVARDVEPSPELVHGVKVLQDIVVLA